MNSLITDIIIAERERDARLIHPLAVEARRELHMQPQPGLRAAVASAFVRAGMCIDSGAAHRVAETVR